MEKLLRFNDLIRGLTDKEYETFTVKLFQDKELFRSLLFNSFLYQLFSAPNQTVNPCNNHFKVDEINSILSKIIEDRELCIKEFDNKPNKNLNEIPKEIINHISTFLNVSQNLKFATVSRFIYRASRSPAKIPQINFSEMQKYDLYFSEHNMENLALITMDRFKFAQELSLGCGQLKAIYYLSQTPFIWNNLRVLELHHCNVPELLIQLTHTKLQSSHIKSLTLYDINFEMEDERYSVDEPQEFYAMMKILSQFKELEYLSLDTNSCIDYYSISPECLSNIPMMSTLKGLSIQWVHPESIINAILSDCSRQLEALHIGANDGIFGYVRMTSPEAVKKYKFENLKELCMYGDIEDEDADILKTICANKLERFCMETMNPHHCCIPDSVISLLCTPSLKYILLKESLKRSINVLDQVLKIKRISLRVNLEFHFPETGWESGLMKRFLDMITMLNKNTQNFMLRVNNAKQLNGCVIGLKQKYLVNKYKNELVISNFGCTLNGYREKWLMACDCCRP